MPDSVNPITIDQILFHSGVKYNYIWKLFSKKINKIDEDWLWNVYKKVFN